MHRHTSPLHARTVAAALAAVAVLALTGCAGGATSPDPESSVPPLAPHDPEAIIARSTHEPPAAAMANRAAGPGDATSDEALVTWAYTAVLRYFDAEYRALPHPNAPKIIADGQTVPVPKACQGPTTTTAENLYYMPCGDSIDIGLSQVREERRDGGFAAILLVLGHEMTHHVQHVAGMPLAADFNQRQAGEWQADCGGGAVIAAAIRARLIRAADVAAATAADLSPTPPHGTAAQRLAAFNRGREGGLPACNSYSLTIVTPPGPSQ